LGSTPEHLLVSRIFVFGVNLPPVVMETLPLDLNESVPTRLHKPDTGKRWHFEKLDLCLAPRGSFDLDCKRSKLLALGIRRLVSFPEQPQVRSEKFS
jgi:hypothetical protein